MLPLLDDDDTGFSGSSAGALVALSLAAGLHVETMAHAVIDSQPECVLRPWRMLDMVARAVRQYIPEGAHKRCSGRLRILLTRIESTAWPPVRPLAVSSFETTQRLRDTLRATCHIPVLGGLKPLNVELPGGLGSASCFDGLAWPSSLCAWRTFSEDDLLLTVSGLWRGLGSLGPPLLVPLHWMILPPSAPLLWRLYRAGFEDAKEFFAAGGGASPKIKALLQSRDRVGDEFAGGKARRERGRIGRVPMHDLVMPLLVGWLQLVCVCTVCGLALRTAWAHVVVR